MSNLFDFDPNNEEQLLALAELNEISRDQAAQNEAILEKMAEFTGATKARKREIKKEIAELQAEGKELRDLFSTKFIEYSQKDKDQDA